MAKSRRRLSFPTVEEGTADQEGKTCELCLVPCTQLSTQNTWKSVPAQQIALEQLALTPHSPVCRSCCGYITRLVRNPEHKPRWTKQRGV